MDEPEREPPHRIHCKSLDCPCYVDGLNAILPALREAVEGDLTKAKKVLQDYARP